MSNIILTGFMGTGKTAVGIEVARRLGRPFLDMDTEIEARSGKPVWRVFAEDGEAMFRDMEVSLCKLLSTKRGMVIATGGGALVNADNRALMLGSGIVICLTGHPDEIVRRLQGMNDRPLLDVDDPYAEIERLLEMRRDAYATIPWQIDTTGLSVETVAARVIEVASVITLPVRHPGGTYDIHIGNSLLAYVGDALRAAGAPAGSQVAIVSNSVVAPLYGVQVEAALRAAGFQPFACSIPDGEQHKTPATVSTLYEQFLAGDLDRSGTVLALGGGVTGDVAGFAAATFMRGVRFAQVPTTLLAMVDASVGGKTGVDLPQGKNLVGAFKQPTMVFIDPTVLATLPAEEIQSGLAEVIKHGVIGAPDLFAQLKAGDGRLSAWWAPSGAAWIAWALRVKIEVVQDDPFEQGRRAVLNLGHTTSHALELLSGFDLRHGDAVAIGMVAAARIAERLGRATLGLAARVEGALLAWGLPVQCPSYDANDIWNAMAHDKKRRGRTLRWVLPLDIGRVEIAEDVPPDVVKSVLSGMGARRYDDRYPREELRAGIRGAADPSLPAVARNDTPVR